MIHANLAHDHSSNVDHDSDNSREVIQINAASNLEDCSNVLDAT